MNKKITSTVRQQPKLTGQIGNTLIYIDPDLEDRKIDIIENGKYMLKASENFDGLNSVEVMANVNPILQNKSLDLMENGKIFISADEEYDALERVEINVNVGVRKITDGRYLFYGNANSNITDILAVCDFELCDYMFYNCTRNIDTTTLHIPTSNATSMRYMFYYSGGTGSSKTTLNLGGLDTSNCTNMEGMFERLKHRNITNTANLNTSKVTNMSRIFGWLTNSNLKILDLSGWDTRNVTNMAAAFANSSQLTSIDLSGWDTSNVTNMDSIFYGLSALSYLDIRNFDFSKVTYKDQFGTDSMPAANIPLNCKIIVKDDAARNWILAGRSGFTNIVTVAEL